MVVTSFGRVEFDLARIPQAASMNAGRGEDSFATTLDEQLESDAAPVAESEAEVEPEVAPATERTTEPKQEPAAEPQDPATATTDAAESPMAIATPGLATTTTPSGEPERRIQASEGSGSPLLSSSKPKAATVNLAEVAMAQVARNGAPVLAGSQLAANPATATAAARTETRIAGIADASPLRAATAKTAATGYRTLTPQGIRLDEQARDSVFKQILFKLGKDGGEMRLRLEPPDLGELDLHLVVENGNSLRLSIGTDRQDLRQLLQSGLGDLTQQLALSGLQVAHAEVHTRQRAKDAPQHELTRTKGNPADDDVAPPAAPAIGTGWLSANGLDFWV